MVKNLNFETIFKQFSVLFFSFLLLIILSGKQVSAYEFHYSGNLGIGESNPPIVSVTNPLNGNYVKGAININANATDDSGIDKVEFYTDSSLLGTDNSAPYSVTWNTTSLLDGLHTLFAKAFDIFGNFASSATVSVTVDNTPPSVSLTNPTNGVTISGVVGLTSSASDNNLVTKVDYFVGANLIGTGGSAPTFPRNWNSTSVSDGIHSLTAKTYDVANNSMTSSAASVTVDNNAPTVSITSPTNGSSVSGNVNITANASDSVGVTSVEFYVDGGLIATDTTFPYSTNWDTTIYSHNSSHSLTTKAYDGAGHATTSTAVLVNVLDITLPSVNITSPLNGSIVPRNKVVTIAANSSDASGVQKVEFRVNNVLKCTDTTPPYSCNWNVPAQRNKSYAIQAKAFDNTSLTATHTINVTSSN